MNRYDYYTRCANFDEQEWLTEELYYPERDDYRYSSDYEDDHRDYAWTDCDDEDEEAEEYGEAEEYRYEDENKKAEDEKKDEGNRAVAAIEEGKGGYDAYDEDEFEGIEC